MSETALLVPMVCVCVCVCSQEPAASNVHVAVKLTADGQIGRECQEKTYTVEPLLKDSPN